MRAQVAETGMSLALVLACRAAVGLGEGVALPSMVNLVSRRVPPALRTTALGSAFTGFHAGSAPPPLPPLVMPS